MQTRKEPFLTLMGDEIDVTDTETGHTKYRLEFIAW